MQYLLLIRSEESVWRGMTEAERQSVYTEYRQLIENLSKQGKFLGGSQLGPVADTATVRVRDGRTSVVDGPFAETKELIGGYFLVEAAGMEEAVSIAARIPSARMGAIEVRPLVMQGAPATADASR